MDNGGTCGVKRRILALWFEIKDIKKYSPRHWSEVLVPSDSKV